MNTMTMRDLAGEFIDIYKTIQGARHKDSCFRILEHCRVWSMASQRRLMHYGTAQKSAYSGASQGLI